MNDDSVTNTLSRVTQGIWRVVPPLFLILGSLGNSIAITVLVRKRMRKSTSSGFLVTLAVTDVLFLYSGLLRRWIIAMFQFDIRHSSVILCKINKFSVYFLADLSGWILVAITFERVFVVWRPHSASKVICRRHPVLVLGLLIAILTAINAHMFFGIGASMIMNGNKTEIEKCTARVNQEYGRFFLTIWPWIDLAVFCIIPFLLLLIGNSLIIARIIINKKKLRSRVGPAGGETVITENKMSSMTALLFALNAVYLFTSTPISIYLLNMDGWAEPDDARGMAISNLFWAICDIMMYANNTFNFVLYFISGRKFREELKSMCCVRKKYNSRTETVDNAMVTQC